MKKVNLFLTICCLFTVGQSSMLYAEAKELYLAPEVAYVLPTDGSVDDTVFVGGRLGYNIDDNWAIEAESGWMEFGWDVADVSAAQNVDVRTVPVIGNIRYGQRCSDEELGWYGFVGVGWASNDVDSNRAGAEIEDSTVWQVGGGVDMRIADKLDGFIDIRYLGNKADITGPDALKREIGNDVDLSAVMFTGGVRF